MNNQFKKSIRDLIKKENWNCNSFGLKMKIGRMSDWNEKNKEIKGHIIIQLIANKKKLKENSWKLIKIKELKFQGSKHKRCKMLRLT